jgi:hypothetical protein
MLNFIDNNILGSKTYTAMCEIKDKNIYLTASDYNIERKIYIFFNLVLLKCSLFLTRNQGTSQPGNKILPLLI